MTDLELTRLCAEAMGLTVIQVNATTYHDTFLNPYNPLHNDAHAMALIKKFNFVIERERSRELFGVTLFGELKSQVYVVRAAKDLNRAICECCAKMQLSKS